MVRASELFPENFLQVFLLFRVSFHFSLSCIGGGNGNPLQCSCLENPRDGGAWWAAVYGVAQSRTRLKRLSSSSSSEIPRRRQWHPTPVLLPGKSHGQRSLVGCSPWGCSESDTAGRLHFHFSLSCIGEGNGNPLQCSCLENTRDRGVWWAAIYRVAQSRTRLKRLSSSSEIPRWFSGKESACQYRRHKRCGFDPWVRKSPWWRKWKPTPVFLSRKVHGQRSRVGYSPWSLKELDTTEHARTFDYKSSMSRLLAFKYQFGN